MRKLIVTFVLGAIIFVILLSVLIERSVDQFLQEFKYEVVTDNNKRLIISEIVSAEWIDAPRSVGDTVFVSIGTGRLSDTKTQNSVLGIITEIKK